MSHGERRKGEQVDEVQDMGIRSRSVQGESILPVIRRYPTGSTPSGRLAMGRCSHQRQPELRHLVTTPRPSRGPEANGMTPAAKVNFSPLVASIY